jgi:hypothetical protein
MKFYNIIKIVLAIFLLSCTIQLPNLYYHIVGFVALIGFTLLAYKAYEDEQKYTIALFITLATIFQPIIKLEIEKPTWNMIYLIVALWLLFNVYLYHRKHGSLA